MTEEEVRQRYAYGNFPEFIEAFKWVTSFLSEPEDYALIAAISGPMPAMFMTRVRL